MGYALQQNDLSLVHSSSQVPLQPVSEIEQHIKKHVLNDKFIELELSQELQTKLDIHSIIKHFSGTISRFIKHSGVQISTIDSNMVAIAGSTAVHHEHVDLILDGEKFGVVTLMTRQSLNDWAAIFFRYLARYLVYPIKNALLIQTLKAQTVTDPLTQAFNRTALDHDLQHEISYSSRYQTPLTVAMIDIDHFKRVNDQYGHTTGDRVLVEVADQIRAQIRKTDSLYRYGGEEFTLILRDTPLEDAISKVESILSHCSQHRCPDIDPDLHITLSAGVTTWAGRGDHGKQMIERADEALYCSKEYGRDQATVAAV